MDEFAFRTPASEMSRAERTSELKTWFPIVEIPFTDQHKRIEELMGRPVFLHEMADPDALIDECGSLGPAISADEAIGKLATRGWPSHLVVAS